MALNIQNNYSNFKEDFKKDTGLDAQKNISEYIAYYNARMTDMNYQLSHHIGNLIMHEFQMLPNNIGIRVSESIKSILRQ